MCRFVKVLSGWVDRTGLSDTVVVAGSYEVTPTWRTEGGVDRSIRGQHRSVRQPVTGSDPTQIPYGLNHPSLLAEGQGVAHATAMAQ